MKQLFFSLLSLFFAQSTFAQVCNDPNAHNTGGSIPCQTCFDGIKNGDEIFIDCGGTNPSCPPCDFTLQLLVKGNAQILGATEMGGNAEKERLIFSRDGDDGFNISYDENFTSGASSNDFLIFEKTDANQTAPDGGILFVNTGSNKVQETAMAIRGNGRVGIGTSSPSATLDVEGNIKSGIPGNGNILLTLDSERAWSFRQFSTGAGTALRLSATDVDNNNKDFIINTEGGVSIGTDLTPDYTLEISGAAGKPGGGLWSNTSDLRLKKDIKDYTDGLKQILQIRPVWYSYNGKFGLPTEPRYVGIIAQEMQEVAPYTITPYTETDDETGETGEYLSYDGSAVVYMLVNAVQEQQVLIEGKDKRIDELEARLAKIEALLSDKTKIDLNLKGGELPRLDQNTPNPFNGQTQINYYLPTNTTKAQLHITDVNGRLLKTLELQGTGEGQINISTNDLPNGNYQYSLIVDGQPFATKQMVMVKE